MVFMNIYGTLDISLDDHFKSRDNITTKHNDGGKYITLFS